MVTLPQDGQHLAIIGRTGSGKTVAGSWSLSTRDFHLKPWLILDYKCDSLIAQMEPEEIGLTEKIPENPGLYVVRPHPAQVDEVEAWLWKIHQAENVGLFVDEGAQLGRSAPYRAILTQGRSKRIPVINVSQRPAWLCREVWSESSYFQVFNLNSRDDRKKVADFVPIVKDYRLPLYHSFYYDVGADELRTFSPVPDTDRILDDIWRKKNSTQKNSTQKRKRFSFV